MTRGDELEAWNFSSSNVPQRPSQQHQIHHWIWTSRTDSVFGHCCYTLPKNHFCHICLPEEDIYWTLTKWDSFTPHKYKINLIPTLTYRCFRICSTASLLQSAAVEDLKRLLLQNGYPQDIITFNINDVPNKNKNKPNEPVATVPKKDVIVLLPYTGLNSNLITKGLKSCVDRFYSFVNVKDIFQNTRRIKSFFPYSINSFPKICNGYTFENVWSCMLSSIRNVRVIRSVFKISLKVRSA